MEKMKTGGRGFKWKEWWEITADRSLGRGNAIKDIRKAVWKPTTL